jgi:hypothetical protein
MAQKYQPRAGRDRPSHHNFAEGDARRHVQQISDRGLAVLRVGELRNVGRDCLIDRLDRAFRDGDADQHCRDRLCHGLREETVAVGARVLIVLEEDCVILRYQQTGRRIAVEIILERIAV